MNNIYVCIYLFISNELTPKQKQKGCIDEINIQNEEDKDAFSQRFYSILLCRKFWSDININEKILNNVQYT